MERLATARHLEFSSLAGKKSKKNKPSIGVNLFVSNLDSLDLRAIRRNNHRPRETHLVLTRWDIILERPRALTLNIMHYYITDHYCLSSSGGGDDDSLGKLQPANTQANCDNELPSQFLYEIDGCQSQCRTYSPID